jgi:hypothetical protein
MKNVLCFDVASAPALTAGLSSGLSAYATNVTKIGPPTTLWLRLCDGRTLRVNVDMHDLSGWEEIGTLTFEVVGADDPPEMVNLPTSWSEVREIQKLVYNSDECEAECGFTLCSRSGDQLAVVPGADIYTLAIQAPFYPSLFTPENDLTAYHRKAF